MLILIYRGTAAAINLSFEVRKASHYIAIASLRRSQVVYSLSLKYVQPMHDVFQISHVERSPRNDRWNAVFKSQVKSKSKKRSESSWVGNAIKELKDEEIKNRITRLSCADGSLEYVAFNRYVWNSNFSLLINFPLFAAIYREESYRNLDLLRRSKLSFRYIV